MAIGKQEAIVRSTNMKWDYFARHFSYGQLADKYGVSRNMCHRIVNRPTTYRVNTDDLVNNLRKEV